MQRERERPENALARERGGGECEKGKKEEIENVKNTET